MWYGDAYEGIEHVGCRILGGAEETVYHGIWAVF